MSSLLSIERDDQLIAKYCVRNIDDYMVSGGEVPAIPDRHIHHVINILTHLDQGERLAPKDSLWLLENHYLRKFAKIGKRYHQNEAWFCAKCFQDCGDPWQAVNASNEYRKADLPTEGLKVLDEVDIESQQDNHLRSCLCNTKGGCKRDLRQFYDALDLAESAHAYEPTSFHPCTLLGAIHYDLGNYSLGDEWFAAAIERGAVRDAVDHELRSIFMRSDSAERQELRCHLLGVDPERYSWVNDPHHIRHEHASAEDHWPWPSSRPNNDIWHR